MKTDNTDLYREIEYRHLELFRVCFLSKEFLPIFAKLKNTILFQHDMYWEFHTKEEVLEYLIDSYGTTQQVQYQGIKYLVDENCYVLYLMIDGILYYIGVKTDGNLITSLFINEKFDESLSEVDPSEILNTIGQAWQNQNWRYIEKFLHRDFIFDLYGCERFLGHSRLNKRQFLYWITSIFKRSRDIKDEKFRVEVFTHCLSVSINNQRRIISMEIINGKIVWAKEINSDPLYYFNRCPRNIFSNKSNKDD